jgi:hypothetical protein
MIHGVRLLGPKTQMMKNTIFKYYKFEEVKTQKEDEEEAKSRNK